MSEFESASEGSTLSEGTAKVREIARDARKTLEQGEQPGQWKAIVADFVREAPLPSLIVAFMLGVIVARR
jgi:hypothetical protein